MPANPVLVFPGQGAQAVGMGKDLADACAEAAALFKRADELLGFPLSKTIFEGPEAALVDTSVQQPALVLVSLAALKALEVKCGKPVEMAAAAGLSLGEYAALAAAGALDFDTAITLVRRRGELMKAAGEKVPCGMAVVLQLEEGKIREACAQAAKETGQVVAPSNFNGGGQIVIGGANEALAKAMELCKAAGARRVMKLPVAGAFHTALMQPAADGLREALAKAKIGKARAPVYANVSAAPVQAPEEIRTSLEKQLTSPVLWEQTVKNLVAQGHTRFLELGPGSTVSNMIKKIAPEAETRAVGTWQDVTAFA
ncbi:MAG: ACP S-malonyltransferase [Planctomycetes bacterium]|nr:ACP S-malonyltransferase [Planctomycetota bacterium]